MTTVSIVTQPVVPEMYFIHDRMTGNLGTAYGMGGKPKFWSKIGHVKTHLAQKFYFHYFLNEKSEIGEFLRERYNIIPDPKNPLYAKFDYIVLPSHYMTADVWTISSSGTKFVGSVMDYVLEHIHKKYAKYLPVPVVFYNLTEKKWEEIDPALFLPKEKKSKK